MAKAAPRNRLTGKEGKKTVDASVYDVLGVKPRPGWPGRRSPSAACC